VRASRGRSPGRRVSRSGGAAQPNLQLVQVDRLLKAARDPERSSLAGGITPT